MNKRNIMLFIALILGFIVFFSSAIFSSYLNTYIRIIVSALLILDVLIILVYTAITWWKSRNISSDPFCGVRMEIIGCCIAFTVWAIAINFI